MGAIWADSLCVVSSHHPTRAFRAEFKRLKALGLRVHHIGPDDLKESERAVPDHAPGRFSLREYQVEAVDRLRAAVLETGRGQLVLATGLGKTVVIAELTTDLLSDQLLGEGRVLVLAHSVPLINQLQLSFWRHLPKSIRTHRLAEGEKPLSFEGITFATIQSFRNNGLFA